MKRPFALLGFTAFAVLALAAYFGSEAVSVPAWLCAGMGLCALLAAAAGRLGQKIYRKTRLSDSAGPGAIFFRSAAPRLIAGGAALLTAALCLFLYQNAWGREIAPAEALDGMELQIRGVVLDYPEEAYHKAYYKLRVEKASASGRSLDVPEFTLRFSTGQPISCKPYDTVECTVKVSAFDRSGGLYSGANLMWANRIALGGYLSDYAAVSVIPGTAWPPGRIFAELRHTIGRNLEKLLPGEETALIRAMLLGEKELIPDLVYGNFKITGTAHLLVVSGLHITALVTLVFLLFGRAPIGRIGRNLLTAGMTVFFLFLTGFPVSAVRAGIMILLFLLADCLGREPDGVNSLGFAMLLICLQNPFSGGSLSFALSAFSNLGIITLADPIEKGLLRPVRRKRRLYRIAKPAASSCGVTLGAMLATLPIQLIAFGGVSLIAPIANLILVLPCTVLLYLSFVAAFLSLLPAAGAAMPFAFCAGWLARFALWASERLARLPAAYLSLTEADAFLAVAVFAGLLLAVYCLNKSHPAACGALTVIVILCGCGVWQSAGNADGAVTMASPADSSCVIVMKNGHAAVLSFGGYRTAAAEELLARNNIREVEAICLPVQSSDAREAAVRVMERYRVGTLILPEGAYLGRDLTLAGEKSARLYPSDGETFSVLDGVLVSVSCGMRRMELTGNGVDVMVEIGSTGEGECQVLFTDQAKSGINSPFTVCQSDDIIEETMDLQDLSFCGMIPGGNGLYVDLLPDGTVSLRGESKCLNWVQTN